MNIKCPRSTATAIIAIAMLAANPLAARAATVAHWSFDTPTITTDANGILTAKDAIGAHNATAERGGAGIFITSTAGQFGQAAAFNNVNANGQAQATDNAWMSFPQSTQIAGASAGDFSVAAWVNVADQASWDDNPILLDWGNVPAAAGIKRFTYWFQLDNVDTNAGLRPRAQMRFDNATDNGGDIIATTLSAAQAGTDGGPTNFDDGAWHHLAWTWNKTTGEMRFYTDGALRHTQTSTQPIENRNLLVSSSPIGALGAKRDNNRYFRGSMDEVWVFDRALGGSEIANLRTTNTIPEPASALVAALGFVALAVEKRRRR